MQSTDSYVNILIYYRNLAYFNLSWIYQAKTPIIKREESERDREVVVNVVSIVLMSSASYYICFMDFSASFISF